MPLTFDLGILQALVILVGFVFQFAYTVYTTKDIKQRIERIEGILLDHWNDQR
jgi:hypothetical protein